MIFVQMAINASRCETGVGTVFVTCGARETRVTLRQRECGRMIEMRTQPARYGVTACAVGAKASAGMIGVGRPLIVGQVASDAIGGNWPKDATLVTGSTGDIGVAAH